MASEDAAGQVGPLKDTDDAALEAQVVRRKRARRGVLGGVVVLAVLALVAVGAFVAGGRQLLPAGRGASGDVPADWTEVSEAGLTLAIPQDFEPYEEMAVGWAVEPEQDDEFGDYSAVIVQPWPLSDESPFPETYGQPVETEVPGAASAEYAWTTEEDALGDLEGALDVELESGRTIRLMIILADVPDPEGTFEQLVGTVKVDPSFDESTLAMPEDEQPVLDVVEELPSGWETQEHQGLKFAVPEDWVEDDTSAARDARWPAVSMNDAAGEFRLKVTTLSSTFDSDEDHSYMYVFEPPPGADRAGAELTPDGGTLTAWLEVRKAGGRTYSINMQVPEGEDGERMVNTVAGNLEFTAEADDLPSYQDLADAQPFIDDAPEIPGDWVVAEGSGFSLRVPPDWADPGAGQDGGVMLNAPSDPSDAGPGESVDAWLVEPGVTGFDEIPIGGYRLDIPGADQAVVRMGDYTEYGEVEANAFNAHAEIRLADGSHLTVGYDGGAGPEFEERFWQILGSLEITTD
ncbi:hypothetical protein [Promicromonospora sp. NPDC023805]|uniref:hypothetical protein n=1 Tax=Promicromonospora sp. NPDC023805 TaxID=3154696 RepID=UPI0033C4D4A1